MKKRLFIFYLLMFLFALPSQAVLKEKDLNNTLSILRNELTQTHQEQKRMQIKFKNSRKICLPSSRKATRTH